MVGESQGFIRDFGVIAYILCIPVGYLKTLLKTLTVICKLLGSWREVCLKEAEYALQINAQGLTLDILEHTTMVHTYL